MQILQTDLHTVPLRISWENLIKDHGIFSLLIILLILFTLSLDNVWILLGENNVVGHHWDLKDSIIHFGSEMSYSRLQYCSAVVQ